jgi:hypothetical protein
MKPGRRNFTGPAFACAIGMEWLEEKEGAQQRESQDAGRGYGCIDIAIVHSLSFPEDARFRRNRRALILRRAPNRRWGR